MSSASSFACSLPELLVLLPYHVGFQLRESLVVVAVRGGAVDLVERVDCPEEALDMLTTARLVAALRRRDPEGVVIAAFSRRTHPDLLLAEVSSRIGRVATVLRVVHVRDGHWRVADEARWRRLPDPADVAIVAEYVGRGISPLADRGLIAASLEPVPDTAVRAALSRAPVPHLLEGLEAWSRVLRGDLDRSAIVPSLALLADIELRDELLRSLVPLTVSRRGRHEAFTLDTGDSPAATRAALVTVVQVAPPHLRAAALCVLALWSWDRGDGATAGIAADAALAADDSYALARLVASLVCLDIRPPAA